MVFTEEKYHIRAILLIIGYVLLCVGGGFFIYLIVVGNPPSITDWAMRRVEFLAIGLTIGAIGFIGILLIFKLLDYSEKPEGQEGLSSYYLSVANMWSYR
jgi:hypothetical protein